MNHKGSIQDFSLVKLKLEKIQEDSKSFNNPSLSFMYLTLELFLGLREDEIEDAITDSNFLKCNGGNGWRDASIDALYIDGNESPNVIHLFNIKYTEKFENTEKNFPSNEIDKTLAALELIMQKDESCHKDINPHLYMKFKEIWNIFESQNPSFVIHFCCNYYNGFVTNEKDRLERGLKKYSNIKPEYHLLDNYTLQLTQKGRQQVDGRIKAIDKNFFEKSDGDIRALIVNLDAKDIIRIVTTDEALRNNTDLDDYSELKNSEILEDAFEDNVRIYLRLRSKINRNIKETALSDDNHRFFYYNNGITITCDHFSYPKSRRAPIIELKNIQIVNGSQTVHALFEAFKVNQDKFEEIDILCRIYQTNNDELSKSIAEYTNSQNPVKSRDIRSNDYTQKKIEAEMELLGYFYERKKSQHQDKPKAKRVDSEKAGQAILAFFVENPGDARDKKRYIFADMYEEIFSDSITAKDILLATKLFDEIENKKREKKAEIILDQKEYEKESFIMHASYYILYIIKKMALKEGQEISFDNFSRLVAFYEKSVDLIRDVVIKHQEKQGESESYNHRVFFKGNKPKMIIEDLL